MKKSDYCRPFVKIWFNHRLIIPDIKHYLTYPCRRYRNVLHELIIRNRSEMLVDYSLLLGIKTLFRKNSYSRGNHLHRIVAEVEHLDLRGMIEEYLLSLRKIDNPRGTVSQIFQIDEITKLHDLETLTMEDLFGFSADEFPQPESLPKLIRLWLESIPSDAAKAIKKRYKSNVHDMYVLKPRSDEWLHENLNNPLRHWDGNEFISKSKYSKSLALWKETRRHLLEAFIQILDEAGICKERNNIMQLIDDNRNW